MSITFYEDGSVTLTDDADPTRTKTVPAGTTMGDINAAALAFFGPGAAARAPDNPTLSDWRVAVTLWGRLDAVTARVAAMVASTDPSQAILGKIAKERLEYANNVLRTQLLQLAPALGFTAADVEESMWRADRVAQGDLSGVWPLPA